MEKTKRIDKTILILDALMIVLLVLLVSALSLYIVFNDNERNHDIRDLSQQIEYEATEHQHNFQPITELVHHDAVTHEVQHDATYRNVTVYKTICNICDEDITGETDEHFEMTGHSSYTNNVPRTESVVDIPAWVETVEDEPAWDEIVVSHYQCDSCYQIKEIVVPEAISE